MTYGKKPITPEEADDNYYLNRYGCYCSDCKAYKQKLEEENMLKHKELVKNLVKPGNDILQDMTPLDAHLVHMALGISGEAGELLDAIKKTAIYNKPIDIKNVIEELGDVEFYMEALRDALSISRDAVLRANIEKLHKRYTSGQYSDKEAQARADKNCSEDNE